MGASGGRGTRRWSGMDFRYPQVVHRPYPCLSRRGDAAVAASHPVHLGGRLPRGPGPRGAELLEAAAPLEEFRTTRPEATRKASAEVYGVGRRYRGVAA